MESLGMPPFSVEIEERSSSMFVQRHVVLFVRDGIVHVTREWAKHVEIDARVFCQALGRALG
eukprot:1739760-Amphidinium_carterae.1